MTTLTVNKLNNKEVSSILNKYVSSSEVRPVLTYASYKNKNLYATDSHQLIKIDPSLIEYITDNTEDHLFNPRTTEIENVNFNYPDVERLIHPYSDNEFAITKVQLNELQKTIKAIKEETGIRYYANLLIDFRTEENGTLSIKGRERSNRISKAATSESKNTDIKINETIIFTLNAQFILNMISTYKKIMKVTGDKEVICQYTSNMRPFNFVLPSKKAHILIMPVRIY